MAKRYKKAPGAPKENGELKSKIVKWLQESGLYTSVQTQPGVTFTVLGRFPKFVEAPGQPLPFFVLQPQEDQTLITVVANVNLAEPHRTMLQGLSDVQRESFFQDLKFELLFRCQFNFRQDEKTKEYLGVQLADTVFLDPPLTKDALMRSIEQVFRTYLFISWKLQALGLTVELSR